MATKLDYQAGVYDGYRGKVGRSIERDYLAGWSMGIGTASEIDCAIYDDEIDAAYAADSMAEDAAEREREYKEHNEEDEA